MSRFRKLSHTLWHCQYHIVWVPKYRHKILKGNIGNEVGNCIKAFSEQKHVEILEMNIQPDHIHLITMIPPKISVSDYCGIVKGRTAIRVFNKYKDLKQKPYWGNHFWKEGYCVDTVGLDSEMIIKYVRYQHTQESKIDRQGKLFKTKIWDNSLSLPPLGARQAYTLIGVNPKPPSLRVDAL